jgi:hypothetical protein
MRTCHWLFVALIACSNRSTSSPAPEPKVAPATGSATGSAAGTPGPSKADPAADPQFNAAMDQMKAAEQTALTELERQQQRQQQQIAKLDQVGRDVEALVTSGDLDRAELRANEMHWQPDAMKADNDDVLLKQYDDRREALLKVIQRKRGRAAPQP